MRLGVEGCRAVEFLSSFSVDALVSTVSRLSSYVLSSVLSSSSLACSFAILH